MGTLAVLKRLPVAMATLGVAIAFVACGDGGGQERQAPVTESGGRADVTISAKNVSFSADTIRVGAGVAATVLFRNEDTVSHTFTVFVGDDTNAESIADSGPVEPGESAEVLVLFGAPGQNTFQCQIHPDRMRGTLSVGQ